jgi:hypothetical protein
MIELLVRFIRTVLGANAPEPQLIPVRVERKRNQLGRR